MSEDAREWIYVYVGEGTTRHIAPHDGQGPTLCGRKGWQVRPLGRYVEDGADCATCERVSQIGRTQSVEQPPVDPQPDR